ncbi:hypothetical protein BDB01DRAFT_847630 [Pilobolus umbonatus]|nr:hypothetical protein BDB01DRAFT_847630 [Pilobolus umbonatus]
MCLPQKGEETTSAITQREEKKKQEEAVLPVVELWERRKEQEMKEWLRVTLIVIGSEPAKKLSSSTLMEGRASGEKGSGEDRNPDRVGVSTLAIISKKLSI